MQAWPWHRSTPYSKQGNVHLHWRVLLTSIILVCHLVACSASENNALPSGEATITDTASQPSSTTISIEEAFASHQRNVMVRGEGRVIRVLPDDTEGNPHQKCIVKLESGITILIAHNIALAPRIASLRQGDTLAFQGEYVWNHKGGTVHWTHHDPKLQHPDGWLRHQGKQYQ